MESNISYLLKPRKRLDKKQVYLRLQSIPGASPELDRPEELPAGTQGTLAKRVSLTETSAFTKGKTAVKWVYKWLARVVLFGLLLLLASLIMFLRPPATQGAIMEEMVQAKRMTAKTSYAVARPVALRWAADSVLVNLSATWDAGGNFHDGAGDWSLLFYSPSNASTAFVSVIDGQAILIDSHGVPKINQELGIDLWQIDSPAVVEQLKANGGNEFLQGQPDATLSLSLDLIGEAGWKARLIHQESRRIFSAQLNVDDGQIIEIHQSG